MDKWPLWKRMTGAPDRLDLLEKRIAELEARPLRDPCPHCDSVNITPRGFPSTVKGIMEQDRLCKDCGKPSRLVKRL